MIKSHINKSILLVIEHGFHAKNILRSKIFEELKSSKISIVILSPVKKNNDFKNEFSGENIFHEYYDYNKYNYSKIFTIFQRINLLSFNSKFKNNFTEFWKHEYLMSKENDLISKKLLNFFLLQVINFISKFPKTITILNRIESLFTLNVHKHIFRKHKPVLVVTSSLGNLGMDRFIMHEAKKNKAKICSLILSWDNPTTKGLRGEGADYVIAWTDKMKDELLKYHQFKNDDIFVGGVPKYDDYFNDNINLENIFISKFKLNTSKRTILLCLESPTAYKWNLELINITLDIVKKNFPNSCQLVIRPHPIYLRVKNGENVFSDDLLKVKRLCEKHDFVQLDDLETVSTELGHDLHYSDSFKLKVLLKKSHVIICFYSSLMIESSIFNTPIINFEMFDKNQIPNKFIAQHAHNKRILDTGGVSRAKSKDDLLKYLKMYLNQPSRNTNGRKLIAKNETGPYKGIAGETIGKYLVNLTHNLTN